MSPSRPLWLETALIARARWFRLDGWRVLGTCSLGAGFIALLAWGRFEFARDFSRELIELLTRVGLVAGVLVAGHALLVVSASRRRLVERHRRGWLTAAPLPRSVVDRFIAICVLLRALGHLMVLTLLLCLIHVFAGTSLAHTSLPAIVIAGFIVGSLCGWLLPHRSGNLREASRYAPRNADAGKGQRGVRALAHWPIAQVFAWQRPENARFVVVAVLFTVQGGTSIAGGLAVMGAWLTAIYLVSLLRAIAVSGRAAANWLRSTPLPFVTFAWSLTKRALLHQVIGVSLAAALGMVLGGPPGMILYMSGLWIAIVVCVSAVTLADSYRGQRSLLRLAVSAMGFAAIEMRAHGWAIPVALVMAGWYASRAVSRRETA
jgi:hypothetical protein